MLDPRIILAGQTPDPVGNFGRGMQTAQMGREFQHQNALRGAIAEHGAGLVQGNQQSVNALAGFDPQMVMGVQNTRSQMNDREQRLQLAYQQANLQAQQFTAQLGAAERQQYQEQLERALAMGTQAQTPQQWDQIMRSVGAEEYVGQFEQRDMLIAGALGVKDALAMGQDDSTTAFQTLHQRALAAGFQPGTPEYQQMMREGAAPQTNINVSTGNIPAGYQQITDPETGAIRMERIPGSPADQDAATAEEQAFARQQQRARAGGTVIQDLQRALDLLPELGAVARQGNVLGAVTRTAQSRVPGTVVDRITDFTESELSNVGLDTLQQMRENSPTGGALGQVPIQQQQRLEQVLGSLKVSQPPDVLEANIKRVINIYTDIIHGSSAERARLVGQGQLSHRENMEIEALYFDLPFDERGRQVDRRPQQPTPMNEQRPPDPSAVELLRNNPTPEYRAFFDEVFGPGAADRALGGQQ